MEEFKFLSPPTVLTIQGQVSIHHDGRIEYLEGYTPDEAAKKFWEAMARWRPRCPKCGS